LRVLCVVGGISCNYHPLFLTFDQKCDWERNTPEYLLTLWIPRHGIPSPVTRTFMRE
jgi:hypothetical protein